MFKGVNQEELKEFMKNGWSYPTVVGSGIPIIGATSGQIPQISAVDENGAPTQWTPVDLPSGGVVGGWEQLADITLDADAQNIVLCEGDLTEYTELYLYVLPINSTDETNKITENVKMYLVFVEGGSIAVQCGSYWHNGNRPNFIDVKILGNTSRTICIDGPNDATSVSYRSSNNLAAKRNGLKIYTHGLKYFGSGSVFKVWGRKE